MGTDLYKYGNHKIRFSGRQFHEIATEIKIVLDNITFPNADFLKHFALDFNRHAPKTVREIKTKQHWTYYEDNEYHTFEEYKVIEFEGPFDLSITFQEHLIKFWNPHFRYWYWFKMDDDILRDEWRKYMKQIVNLFGGDRVIYLPDNGHPLEEFLDMEGTFEELEKALLERYGAPKTTFKAVAADFDNAYFIDDFKSIDWSNSKPIDDYLPIPDETSSTAYDLKVYANKEKLKWLKFDDELIQHKLIEGKMYFYHLARVEGLLCIHTGIVGDEKDNIVVQLDRYAPFTYDDITKNINDEGYCSDRYAKTFEVLLNGQENIYSWADALKYFNLELKWRGLGGKGGGVYSQEKSEERFYAVDEKLALKLLLDIGKQYNATGSIEVYRYDEPLCLLCQEENVKNRILIFKQ